jgi:AcrR family transcriptional regulator
VPRRRGRALERAIYDAVLVELIERGFGALTIEGVAERARTGKSVLYRRWSTKRELVSATFRNVVPTPVAPEPTGDLRTDLLNLLRQLADALAGPFGIALRADVNSPHPHPALVAARYARQRHLRTILRAGIDRGEVRSDALVVECVNAGPALLYQQFLDGDGTPLPDAVVVRIVDHVLLPLVLRQQPRSRRLHSLTRPTASG